MKISPVQAYCPSNSGRSEPSFGRRRRDINSTVAAADNDTVEFKPTVSDNVNKTDGKDANSVYKISYEEATVDKYLKDDVETPSHVRKMIEASIRFFILL